MVESNHMDIFIKSCNQARSVTKPLFFKFNENQYVQSEHYDRTHNVFRRRDSSGKSLECSPESSPKPSPDRNIQRNRKVIKNTDKKTHMNDDTSTSYNESIILKNISHIFFKLINPIGNRDDDIESFCKILDKYTHLLKTITSRHKQLHKQISDYVSSKNSDCSDMCHLNKQYMTFWSKLLNCDIYIIFSKTSQYQEYLNSVQNKYIVIKYIEEKGYELMNTSESTFIEFNKKFQYKPWIDINKLSSYSIKELREICNIHNIQVGAIKNKKTDIIELIKAKFE